MARLIYTLAFYLAQPVVWLRLPGGRASNPNIFITGGALWPLPTGGTDRLIWLHVVSVGETRAAEPLTGLAARAAIPSTSC